MKVINRIKENKDFTLAIKNGKSLRTQSCYLNVIKNDFGRVRVGISASKKLGNAVTRNRVKRQIRAMCDDIIIYNNGSYDIVIIPKIGFLEKSFLENKETLRKGLSEVTTGVIK